MKKNIKLFSMVIFLCSCLFILSGCFSIKSEADIANSNFEVLISNIENKEKDEIKKLFALNKINTITNFDENINQLFDYYNGIYTSHLSHGLGVENDSHDGNAVKKFDMSYDVKTTNGDYRIAIIWCINDTSDIGNIGIWSLYVLKFEDDPNQTYAYRGDESSDYGIIIGKPVIK